MEEEEGGTEVELLALEPSTGPAAGAAAVKVSFYVDAGVRGVSGFDTAERDGDCFKDHRRQNLWCQETLEGVRPDPLMLSS
jgi:hypothetical protein